MTNQNRSGGKRSKAQRKKNKNKKFKRNEFNASSFSSPSPSSSSSSSSATDRRYASGTLRKLALAVDLALLLKEEERVDEKLSFFIRRETNNDGKPKEESDLTNSESSKHSLKNPKKEKEKGKEKEDSFQLRIQKEKTTKRNTNQKQSCGKFLRLLEREKEIKTWLQKRKKLCENQKSLCLVPFFPFANNTLQGSIVEKYENGNQNQERSTCSPHCLFWNRIGRNDRAKEISSSAYAKFLEFLKKKTKHYQEDAKNCNTLESELSKFYIDISITKYSALHYEFDNFEIKKKEEKFALMNEKKEYLLRHTDGRILVMKDAREVVPFAIFLKDKKLPTSRFWLRNQKHAKKEKHEENKSNSSFPAFRRCEEKNSVVCRSYGNPMQTRKSQIIKTKDEKKRTNPPSSSQSNGGKEVGEVENTINQIVSTLERCGFWISKPENP